MKKETKASKPTKTTAKTTAKKKETPKENMEFPKMFENLMGMFEGLNTGDGCVGCKCEGISFVKDNPSAVLPTYGSEGASGFDLSSVDAFTIKTGECKVIDTGLKLASLPESLELQIRSRSGLAAKDSIFCLNSPGTIDNDYRGNIKVILYNLGPDKSFLKGARIAQCVPQDRLRQFELKFVDVVKETPRGDGGLGSTGI